jgi:hypothetical protein
MISSIVAANTSLRMPSLMSSFDYFFGVSGAPAWERELWNGFLSKLGEQSENVIKADKARDVEFKYFDPARFECSVSV